MAEVMKQAATILAGAKRLGAEYTVTYREAESAYYQRDLEKRIAHAFSRELADGLVPDVIDFVTDKRDLDHVGIKYRSEMVVLTIADFRALCSAVNTAIRLEAMRTMETQPNDHTS